MFISVVLSNAKLVLYEVKTETSYNVKYYELMLYKLYELYLL